MHSLVRKSSFSKAQGLRETGPWGGSRTGSRGWRGGAGRGGAGGGGGGLGGGGGGGEGGEGGGGGGGDGSRVSLNSGQGRC